MGFELPTSYVLALRPVGTGMATDPIATAESTATEPEGQTIDLIRAGLDLPDGEYAVYDSTARMFGAVFVVRSSGGVIGANWRPATPEDAGIRFA